MPRPAELARPRLWGPAVTLAALLLVIWQLYARSQRFVLPTIGSVASHLWDNAGALSSNAVITLESAVIGLVTSAAAAVAIALAMSQWGLVRRAVLPLAIVLNVTPLIAIAPALSDGLGLGAAPRVLIVVLITFFPVLINTLGGLESYDPQALEVLETLSASRWEVLWRLKLPSSLPFLFAAARVVVPLSIVGAAIAEMTVDGIGNGLGYTIYFAGNGADLGLAWAAVFCLAIMGLVLTGLVVGVEDLVLRRRGFRS